MNYWDYTGGGNYLAHHGIQGQSWGVRNGPPYPLDSAKLTKKEKGEAVLTTAGGIAGMYVGGLAASAVTSAVLAATANITIGAITGSIAGPAGTIAGGIAGSILTAQYIKKKKIESLGKSS